jgi:signal transduction histidine kinase
MSLRVSIGQRAYILVACQVAITTLLALTALFGFSRTANYHDIETIRSTRMLLFTIGLASTGATLFIGLAVLRIIVPGIRRLRRMVEHVRSFQETGVASRIGDTASDDISALANALDAGLTAIASREEERAKFLAIAAHELKTPMTAIHGYASLLLTHPKDQLQISRAIEIINHQSARLTRLIEALLLAMRARNGKLHFEPKPFNMSLLVLKVLHEMQPCLCDKTFSHCVASNISILGDQALLEHALWALFTCAAALSPDNCSVQVAFVARRRASLSVDIKSSVIPIPEVQELFMPFRDVEYETGAGIRSAIGLYLCREIVRVHNGQLYVHQVSEKHPEFLMELPI